jgi:WD40 repeat protein
MLYLASCSRDKNICIWNLQTKQLSTCLPGHKKGVNSLVSLYNQQLASTGLEGTIRLWNVQVEKCVGIMDGHTKTMSSIDVLSGKIITQTKM